MKKYENPEIKILDFSFENDVLTDASVIDIPNTEVGKDKDDTTAPF